MANHRVNGMQIGILQTVCDHEAGDPATIAKPAEELGFESYWLPEHVVLPAQAYPGKLPEEPVPGYLFKMPDLLIALARASAVTSRDRIRNRLSRSR